MKIFVIAAGLLGLWFNGMADAQSLSGAPAGVSSVTFGTGLAGGTISAGQSGTATLVTVPNHQIFANTSGGTAIPIQTSLTGWFNDALNNGAGCTAQGSVIYKGVSTWDCLGAGTSGLPLLSQGTSANPAYGVLGVASGGTGLTAGTSGGILAYTASGTLASSGALTANLPVIGGGAGVAPTVGTRSGNTTQFVTTTGTLTNGDCVKIDASGNFIANGSACGSGGTSGGGTFNYSDNGVTVTANTYFIPIGGGGVPTTTEANVSVAAPAATTVSNLQVSVSVAPGAGNSYAITLRDAGADKAVTCTISNTATTCSDTTHSFNVVAGDLINWKFVSAGTIVTTPTVNITAANGTSNVGVTSIATTSPITGGTITTTGTIACATCTTNAAALTANQLVIGGGSQAAAALGSLGTTTTVLHGNAAGAPTFGATSLTADVSGTLPVGNGGTGQTAPTNHGVILGQGASATVTTAAMTDGQLLVGQTSADPLPKTVSGDATLAASGAVTVSKLAGQSYYNIVSVAGAPLPNAIFKRVVGSNLATGDTDLYTVPANKRAVIQSCSAFNPSAGTVAFYYEASISGTYYRLITTVSPATGTQPTAQNITIVLEATQKFSINTATTAGLNAACQVIEFDNTGPLKSSIVTGLSTGHNTIYTVTAGKSALMVGQGILGVGNAPTGAVNFVSDSGGARTITVYDVASGGSAGTTNQMTAAVSTAASNRSNVLSSNFTATMTAGDFVDLNVDTGNAAQIAWVTVVEF